MSKCLIVAIVSGLLSASALAQSDSLPASDQPSISTGQEEVPPHASARIPESAAAGPDSSVVVAPKSNALDSRGLRTAEVSDLAVRFDAVQPAHLMSSNLIGISVYNKQDSALGTIRDLGIDSDKVAGVVVRVGGILGLAESYVVLDPATILVTQKRGGWRAYINTTANSLASAPKFTYPKK